MASAVSCSLEGGGRTGVPASRGSAAPGMDDGTGGVRSAMLARRRRGPTSRDLYHVPNLTPQTHICPARFRTLATCSPHPPPPPHPPLPPPPPSPPRGGPPPPPPGVQRARSRLWVPDSRLPVPSAG